MDRFPAASGNLHSQSSRSVEPRGVYCPTSQLLASHPQTDNLDFRIPFTILLQADLAEVASLWCGPQCSKRCMNGEPKASPTPETQFSLFDDLPSSACLKWFWSTKHFDSTLHAHLYSTTKAKFQPCQVRKVLSCV